jgi:hypothetical protein
VLTDRENRENREFAGNFDNLENAGKMQGIF